MDWEQERIRVAVRDGAMKGVADGTDAPGGDGPGLAHLAAIPAKAGKRIKAQEKQSAQDKAQHQAITDSAAAVQSNRPARPKKGPKAASKSPPHGVCHDWWNTGKCARRQTDAGCKWDHIRDGDKAAAGYIAKAAEKAKAKAKAKTKAGAPDKTTPKLKKDTPCRLFKQGECKHGNKCEYSLF